MYKRAFTFFDKLYSKSPKAIVGSAYKRLRLACYTAFSSKPMAKVLNDSYYVARNTLITGFIQKVGMGESVDQVLSGFDARQYDERVAEYTYFSAWLQRAGKQAEILDVGCVLNNSLVDPVLTTSCESVWFCNVDLEPVAVEVPVYYHLSTLQDAFQNGRKFDVITSLSTIEHIGYDNSQYGSSVPAIYTEPEVEPLVNSIVKIVDLLNVGGRFLISVPYGCREVLIHPYTLKKASQVFDFDAIQAAINAISAKVSELEFDVYQISSEGWSKVDAEQCQARYADGCPAAAAVAFISAVRTT